MAAEADVEKVTQDMDGLSFDPGMKKKKKKSVAFDDPTTADVAPTEHATEGISSHQTSILWNLLTF
jgi:hypothetical protein